MEGPFPGREGQVLRRRGGLLHLLPRAKAAAAIRTEPRRNSEAFEPGSWSNVPAGPPRAWLFGLFAALTAHGATVSSCQSRRSYTTFQTPQARHGRTSPRLRSRRAKAASWWCNSSLLWPPRAGTLGSWLRCPRGTNCSEGPTVCCGAAERPEVADLLKVLDTQEKARYKVGGATCSNPYNVTGRRTRTCGWDPRRSAEPLIPRVRSCPRSSSVSTSAGCCRHPCPTRKGRGG